MGLRRGIYAFGTLLAGTGLLAESPAFAQAVAPTREELTRPELAPPPAKSTLNVIGGVEFVKPPEKSHWGGFAIFRDPDGNQFVLSTR